MLGASEATAFALWRLLDGRPGGNPIPLIEKTFGVQATGRFRGGRPMAVSPWLL